MAPADFEPRAAKLHGLCISASQAPAFGIASGQALQAFAAPYVAPEQASLAGCTATTAIASEGGADGFAFCRAA